MMSRRVESARALKIRSTSASESPFTTTIWLYVNANAATPQPLFRFAVTCGGLFDLSQLFAVNYGCFWTLAPHMPQTGSTVGATFERRIPLA